MDTTATSPSGVATMAHRRDKHCFPGLIWTLGACLFTFAPEARAQANYPTPYTFTTLAGYSGHGANDGTGTAARFWDPAGVAVDGAGNVYVADRANSTIRKVTASGVVTTLAGLAGHSGNADGTGNAARFDNPSDVAVDGTGNVYVANSGNRTIRKVTSAGVVSTLAGPWGRLTVDSAGNVCVVDRQNYTVSKITPAGVFTTSTTNRTGSTPRFWNPSAVAVDRACNVYVVESGDDRIQKLTPEGMVTTFAGREDRVGVERVMGDGEGHADGDGNVARFNFPEGLAIDRTGKLYVADSANGTIREITPAGHVTTLAGLAGQFGSADGTGSAARFWRPSGLAVDGAGNVYVTDRANNNIRKVTPSGAVTTLAGMAGGAGSADGTRSAARFCYPSGVAVDGAGNVFVVDSRNYTIRKVTPTGVVTTLAGLAGQSGSMDGSGSAARFDYPSGVATDVAGNIYVADTANNTIRKVTPEGRVTTMAGLSGYYGSTDGTGSEARFFGPHGVAVDHAGNVYVTDSANGTTIRKVTPAGVVTSLAGLTGSAGSADGTGRDARFYLLNSAAVDSAGNVYVTDSGNRTIRKVTPAGEVTTLAGLTGKRGSADGAGRAARFGAPCGLAVDSAGNLYVGDDKTMRKVTPAGDVTTLAGLAGKFGSEDGTGSAARFWDLSGVAVDQSGNVYVADNQNHTIRKGFPFKAATPVGP